MADFDEELRKDEDENIQEAEYILDTLPSELKEKYSQDDILYMMDIILDYYFNSGVLDADPDDEGFVDIDLAKVANYVCDKAKEENHGTYEPDEVFFVVQADMDFQESHLDEE